MFTSPHLKILSVLFKAALIYKNQKHETVAVVYKMAWHSIYCFILYCKVSVAEGLKIEVGSA